MSGYDATLSDGVTTVGLKYDFVSGKGGGTSATGTHTFQNSTPTDEQFKNSEPGLGDTSPYSVHTYTAQNGSIGKWSEVEAPADLSRSYLCDLDNTRPGVLAPRLQWFLNSGSVSFGATPGGSTRWSATYMIGVSSITNGDGILVQTLGGTDAGWWLFSYDPTTAQYLPTRRVPTTVGGFLPYFSGSNGLRVAPFAPTCTETSGKLWVPLNTGGVIDALAAYPQTTVQAGTYFAYLVPFAGMTFAFEWGPYTAPTINISLRDNATLAVLTPATLAGTPAPELGNGSISVPVANIAILHQPVVFNGAIYFASDREVFKCVWDDNAMKIVVVPIKTNFTRVTAGPVVYQGSLFVGSGNTLWKWTPGQTEWTPQPLDSFGVLPQDRGGGVIVSLRAVSNGLLVATMSDPVTGTDATLLMVDANGVVAIVDSVLSGSTGVVKAVGTNLLTFVDTYASAFSPVVGVLTRNTTSLRVVPIYESNRDPSFLTAANRKQVLGSHFWVGPWDPGQSYADRKQSLKLAALVADVTVACKIRVYYQTDSEYLLADSLDSANGGYGGTVSSTVMAGQGTWHLGFTLSNATAGLVNTSGSAFAGYAEQSLIAKNLSYRQIRLCVEIVSDTTGTVYPRLLGLKHYFSETPAMYIVHSIRHRIMAEDPDLKSGISPAPPTDAAGVYSVFSTLLNWAKSGTFLDFLDANGDTRKVKYTKFIWNGVDMIDNIDAAPTLGRRRYRKMVLQAALQEAESAA